MSLLYTALLWLAVPFAIARLLWRSRRQAAYRQHLRERLGFVPPMPSGPVLWIHAVSLGETRAAEPLVRWARQHLPAARILLTHTTPTGRQAGRELFGSDVVQAWLPWDLPFAMNRFFARARPSLGLVMETEVWPNLLAASKRTGTPVFLVNARLSERSAARYARARGFARDVMGRFAGIAAQTDADARRLEALGAKSVAVTGNLKFDVPLPEGLRARADQLRAWAGPGRFVWVMGSTREGEEALLVEALTKAVLPPEVLVVIVPRHPQRFDEVAALIERVAGPAPRRSDGGIVPATARFALGDSMGEMMAYYSAAGVAFVGGSLLPFGGQNLIEACATGRPVLIGPHTFNFSAAAEEALRRGAALRVDGANELIHAALALTRDPIQRASLGEAALAFTRENRGALDRLARWLEPALGAIRERARGSPAPDRVP